MSDDTMHTCAVCGRLAPCFTEYLAPAPDLGIPAGWVCVDDEERVREVEDEAAAQYALSATDRARVVEALRAAIAARSLDPADMRAANWSAIADRLGAAPRVTL